MYTMDEATLRAVERMGLWWESQGLPRIAGRILGFLALQPAPVTLEDIAGALRVSKASVSTDARRLDRLGLVTRVSMPGDRRDYYEITADMPRRVCCERIQALEGLRDTLTAAAALPATEPTVRNRLENFSRYQKRVIEQLNAMLSALDEEKSSPSRSADHSHD